MRDAAETCCLSCGFDRSLCGQSLLQKGLNKIACAKLENASWKHESIFLRSRMTCQMEREVLFFVFSFFLPPSPPPPKCKKTKNRTAKAHPRFYFLSVLLPSLLWSVAAGSRWVTLCDFFFSSLFKGGPMECTRGDPDHAEVSRNIGSKFRDIQAFARAFLCLFQLSFHSSCLVMTVALGMTVAVSFI